MSVCNLNIDRMRRIFVLHNVAQTNSNEINAKSNEKFNTRQQKNKLSEYYLNSISVCVNSN